jgi:hypothetical protein
MIFKGPSTLRASCGEAEVALGGKGLHGTGDPEEPKQGAQKRRPGPKVRRPGEPARLGFPHRVLAPRFIAPSTCLKKEPGASLRLVDPYFDQTRARHIPTLVADPVRLAHGCGELLIIVA